MKTPNTPRLADKDSEEARRIHEECIRELQDLPATGLRVIADITLADGIATPIAHRLGRKPVWICPSAVRGALATGRIMETRTGGHDRTQVVILTATGMGGPVTIDLAVM